MGIGAGNRKHPWLGSRRNIKSYRTLETNENPGAPGAHPPWHRAAPAPPPMGLRLAVDPGPPHLEIREIPATDTDSRPLPERVMAALDCDEPRRQEDLRAALQVRNQTLTEVLHDLERRLRVLRKPDGWLRAPLR